MKRSQILRQQWAAIIDQMRAIHDKAAAESRDLTEDENKAWDTLKAEAELKRAAVQRAEDQEKLDDESRAALNPAIRDSDPPAGEQRAGGAADPDAAVRGEWYARRFGTVSAGAEQVARELYGESFQATSYQKHRGFNTYLRSGDMGDQALARTILLTPQQIVNFAASGLTVRELRATMIEGDDTLGGYVAPEDIRMELIQRLPGLTAVRPRANVITTSRDRVSFPRVTGGGNQYAGAVRVTWVDETPTATQAATNATFGQIGIPIYTVMAHTDLSRNLVEDAAIDLGSYLMGEFTTAAAIDEDIQFLTSAGAGTPEGVLLNNTTGGPNNADITTVNSGAAAGLTADGILAVPFGLPGQYRGLPGTAWVAAKATVLAVAQLKDGAGRYLWADNGNPLAPETGARLAGYPLAESEAMPAVTTNTYPLIFGAWSGYMIADRVGMSVQRYDDSTLGKQNLVSYVMRRRLGGQVTHGFKFVVQKCST